MNDLIQLINKYRGYLRDPEGSAPEIMDMFFVRDQIEQILEGHDSAKNLSPDIHRQIMELDDEFWHNIHLFIEVIGSQALSHARLQLNIPRKRWWWFIDELSPKRAAIGW
jgi:hypothetical protein